jgi:hypothetical protein
MARSRPGSLQLVSGGGSSRGWLGGAPPLSGGVEVEPAFDKHSLGLPRNAPAARTQPHAVCTGFAPASLSRPKTHLSSSLALTSESSVFQQSHQDAPREFCCEVPSECRITQIRSARRTRRSARAISPWNGSRGVNSSTRVCLRGDSGSYRIFRWVRLLYLSP